MKLFISPGVAVVPSHWIKAMDPKSTRVQAHVFVYARTKRDAFDLLVESGLSEQSALNVGKQLRLDGSSGPGGVRVLIEAGVVDPEQRGAYGYREGNQNDPVVRLDVPDLPVVAHFRYRDNAEAVRTGLPVGLYAEAVKADDTRITWTSTKYGGYVGKIDGLTIAQLSWGTVSRGYVLRMTLPGFKDADGLDEKDAKSLAEKRVEGFVRHLGAEFK